MINPKITSEIRADINPTVIAMSAPSSLARLEAIAAIAVAKRIDDQNEKRLLFILLSG